MTMEILNHEPAPAEPTTKPAPTTEPGTAPDQRPDKSPWSVPGPLVQPGPKA